MHIKVRVRTGSKNDKVTELTPSEFKIEVREDPQDNQANDRVRALLANHFKIDAGKVHMIRGHHKPSKILEIV